MGNPDVSETLLAQDVELRSNSEAESGRLEDGLIEQLDSEIRPTRTFWERIKLMGPGIMVCLADTDGPCLITAAQSGAQFQYYLLLPQLLLIPVLYMAQELTVRLGLFTGKGVTELVRERFGVIAGYVFCAYVLIICIGAIISEIVCITEAATILGCNNILACFLMVAFLCAVVISGGYRTVEKIGVALGALQLIFLPLIFLSLPDWGTMWHQLWNYSWIFETDEDPRRWKDYTLLLAANIGAVIMPWMLFYQQSAVCMKKDITKSDLKIARWDTAIGSALTQIIMSALVISVAAAAARKKEDGTEITKVIDIITRLEPYLGGETAAKWIICIGMFGASLVAALVVSLCGAWCVAEAMGKPRSLDMHVRDAPHFYVGYVLVLIASAFICFAVERTESVVNFNIGVQVFNAVTMPVVVVMITFFACSNALLPNEVLLQGWYKNTCIAVFGIVSIFSLASIPVSFSGN